MLRRISASTSSAFDQRNRAQRACLIPIVLLFAILGPLSACSKKQRTGWNEQMRGIFNNTSVQPPEPDRLYWSRKEDETFLRRMGHADVTAVGTIRRISTFTAFSNPKRVALAFRPTEVLHGEMDKIVDAAGEIAVELDEGQLDFHLALNIASTIPGRSYLLFLKEKPHPGQKKISGWEGSITQPTKLPAKYFWALYRPDKKLLSEVRAMYAWLKRR